MKTLRVLAICLAAACGAEPADAQLWGGGAWGAPPSSAGAASDPTPTFSLADDLEDAFRGALDASSVGFAPTIDCDNADDNGTTLECDTGGSFAEGWAGMAHGQATPFTTTTTKYTDYDRFGYHDAANTTLGQGSTTDFLLFFSVEIKAQTALKTVVGNIDRAANEGYGVQISAGNVLEGYVNNATFGGAWTVPDNPTTVIGAIACNAGGGAGSARLYLGQVHMGSAGTCPSLTKSTVATPRKFTIGAGPAGDRAIDGRVSRTVLWQGELFATTAAQDALVKLVMNRFYGLEDDASFQRAGVATMCTDPDEDGDDMCHQLAPHIPRIERIKGRGGVYQNAYYSGAPVENLLTRASEFGDAAWTKLTAADTITANQLFVPYIATDAIGDRYTAASDVSDLQHGVTRDIDIAAESSAGVHVLGHSFSYANDTGVEKEFGYLRFTDVTDAYAFFDLTTCDPVEWGAGLYDAGGEIGIYKSARVYDMGTSFSKKQCYTEIVASLTAAVHTVEIGFATVPGDFTYGTAGAEIAGTMHGARLYKQEQQTMGWRLVDTTSAQVTSGYDVLQYPITTERVPAGGVQIFNEVQFPNVGAATSYVCSLHLDSSHKFVSRTTSSTGNSKRNGGACTGGGGLFITVNDGSTDAQNNDCGNTPAGDWCAPVHPVWDGKTHHWRTIAMTNDVRTFADGDPIACTFDQSSVTFPDLTGGVIDVGIDSIGTSGWPDGHILDCELSATAYVKRLP